jgi:putative flavoprotein involved in K+ transport
MTLVHVTDTVVVGAGQAGLALSRFLAAEGHRHVVLERGRIGERWLSERWPSLSLLTPNWLNVLPGMEHHADPDGFLPVSDFVDSLERYASSFDAPVVEGVTVLGVETDPRGFRVDTDRGAWTARQVVLASGDCDLGLVPTAAAGVPAGVASFHASRYWAPDQLAAGGVLVVGAGPSGQQLAAELRRAGRRVVLAVGRHARMPRRYRGRDVFAWLHDIGQLDTRTHEVPDLAAARKAPSFPVSGARGGETLGLDKLAGLGVEVAGRLAGFGGGEARFAANLPVEIGEAERRLRRTLDRIDEHILQTGAPAPAPNRPSPVSLGAGPAGVALGGEIRTVLWATGYRRAYPWLEVPVLDSAGELAHEEGFTAAPGLYALGLRFQRKRKSHFLGGVGEDAARIATAVAARSEAAHLDAPGTALPAARSARVA